MTDFTMSSDFWQNFALVLAGLFVLSIVVAALWVYIFKDQ